MNIIGTKCILLLSLCILIIGCDSIEANVTNIDLDKRENLVKVSADSLILKSTLGLVMLHDQAFTGISIADYPNGKPKASIQYFQGKKHGKQIKWFENGIKSYEAHYQSNKQHGKTRSWWSNGNLRSESNYDLGVATGAQLQWYASGAKFKRINLVDGKEEGLQQSWRENGKIYNNYEAKNGRIFGLKRSKLCYELDDEVVQYNPG